MLFNYNKVLITGGAGFIGSNLIIKLLKETSLVIYNIDKLGYASNQKGINECLDDLGSTAKNRYKFFHIDLFNIDQIKNVLKTSDPDIILNLAAESHVDNSIANPRIFIESNVVGTYNLLEASLDFYRRLSISRRKKFRFLHVSTDEVFGSLNNKGYFSDKSKYDPRSPYSASKAASDHFVKAWYHTYNLPILITNCGNNYGPWQFPEKLIPKIILNAISHEKIPIYGNGLNIRDWIFVDDHIDALLLVLQKGKIGESYLIGAQEEKTNLEIVNLICTSLDQLKPFKGKYNSHIEFVTDRLGHDKRYSIDPSKIKKDLGWSKKFKFEDALYMTVKWYLSNLDWAQKSIENKNN